MSCCTAVVYHISPPLVYIDNTIQSNVFMQKQLATSPNKELPVAPVYIV